ncbi:MAG: PKD domain-containing protein [Armatimonadota bacterium]|nr:PKD domain-containing protein [Armatimonadota bacterium]
MRVIGTYSASIILLLFVISTAALADTAIYSGQTAADAGLILGPWGSGSADENSEKTLTGTKSIRVITGGWFEGGSIEFKTTVALFKDKPAAGDYFVLTVAPTMQSVMSTDTSDRSWYVRGSSPAASKSFDFGAETLQRPKIQRLRLVLTDAAGRRSELQTALVPSDESGWMHAAIPLSKFKTAAGYDLKKMLVFSDVADTIYIGAIKIAQDNRPITADSSDDLSYATGDWVPFKADVTAGLSSFRCSWDFDNKDGVQEDAAGEYAKHVFTTAGDYFVTLTVSDTSGVKSAFTKSIKVHIE